MKAWLDRILGRGNPAAQSNPAAAGDPAPLPAVTADERVSWLRDQVRRDVAAGFDDEAAILTNASGVFADDFAPAELRVQAQRFLREALAEHAEAQANWPARTDWDRLADGFAALEANGVVARHNFTCCGTCGSAEIWDEIETVTDVGKPVHGYAFYHVQDTESAVDGHGLYLNYGACEEGEVAALAVANEIVEQLAAHDLKTEWSGDWDQRIGVSLDWKRRR